MMSFVRFLEVFFSKIEYLSNLLIKRFGAKRLFWFSVIAIAFIYKLNHRVFERPGGIHQWRNCVSAGFAVGLKHKASFFEPEFGAFIGNNHTEQVYQLEFPLMYYAVSILYKTFGTHEFLFRLLNIIIGLIGLFALFKASHIYLKDYYHAWFVPLYLFTSGLFVFYLNNFIPDVTAFAFVLMGFYQFVKFLDQGKFKFFVYSLLFLTIGGLLKVPSLMLFFSIVALFVLEAVFKVDLKKDRKVFDKPWRFVFLFLISLGFVVGYTIYAKQYSDAHNTHTSIRLSRSGIWNYDYETIAQIWGSLVRRFKAGYFHSPIFLYFTAGVVLHNLIFLKKYNRILNIITYLVFFQGFIVFNLVFYFSIGRCDYYQINNLIFIALLLLNFAWYLSRNYGKVFYNFKFKVLLFAVPVLLVIVGKNAMDYRYSDWHYWKSQKIVKKIGNITPYLRNLGIERSDRVYYTPDRSHNISLYLMDQLGNTDFALPHRNKVKNIKYLKSKGMKYFILGEEKLLKKDKELAKYLKKQKLVGTFNKVRIYEIE
jgi:hypothetical protein